MINGEYDRIVEKYKPYFSFDEDGNMKHFFLYKDLPLNYYFLFIDNEFQMYISSYFLDLRVETLEEFEHFSEMIWWDYYSRGLEE